MQDCRRLPLQGVSRSCAVKFIIYIIATKDPSLCSFAGKAQHKFSGCELRIVIWKVMAGVAIVPENQIFHFRDMYMYDQH